MSRPEPNIIITGTPGVGKTSHAQRIAQKTGLHHLDINEVVKAHNIGEKNPDNSDANTKIVDEDRLLDVIENDLADGGQIIDWHACDLFPPRLIDLVCVVRCENGKLYDRLRARGYSEAKLQENLDCEIMEVLLQEAKEAYDDQIVMELKSAVAEDMDGNVDRISLWVEQWKRNKGQGGDVQVQNKGAGSKDPDEDNPMFLHG